MKRKKIGHIVNTFGLKGMIKVSTTCTDPSVRFAPKNKILIQNEENVLEEYEISSLIVKNKKTVYIGLTKYNDINQVLFMKERDVFCDVKIEKDTFFYDDLVNLSLFSSDKKLLGKISNVVDMPAGQYLLIDDKILIPFKLDLFIESVNIKEKEVILTPLGLETFNSSNEN